LTGERLETRNMLSGMGFLNTHRLVCDEKIMELCGVAPEQFGELGDYRDVRPLLKGPADALGVAAGIPVVPAHSDGALNQLGSGCMGAGQMTFSVGTSAAIRLSTDRPVLSDPPATWCYAGVKGWLSGAATNGACNCVNWFRETVLRGKWSFGELNEELLSEAHTPVFLPFVFGERCPGWNDARRGRFCDLNGQDGVADMFRAIAEGVLFNVFQCYRILVRLAGEPRRIILSGGILHAEKWAQMAADIFQLRMELSEALHDSLIGGAALALHAAGALREPEDFVCVSGGGKAVVPRAGEEARYEEKFRRYTVCDSMSGE
jgi:gluconokinase